MKVNICLSIFLLWVQFCSASISFNEWCIQYNKQYGSADEAAEREKVYHENVRTIEELNSKNKEREVFFAVNQFADMTPTEFRHRVLMRPSKPEAFRQTVSYPSPEAVPDSFNWQDKGVVTSVKDQGSAGSCWAFSTGGNVEGQWAKAGNNLTSLSAEQLVDCDATYDPKNLNMDCGVFGGWPYLAYQYIMKTGGIESESSYPYCSGQGTCFPCVPKGWNKTRCGPPPPYCNNTYSCFNKLDKSKFVPGLKVKSWIAISKNETEMVNALLQQGPLSILINAQFLQYYHSGVWDPIWRCDPTSLDHAVLLVGYGTHKGKVSTKPYWLIKNSWGKKWGENGYFKIVRGKGKCGVNQQVTSAILE